VLAELERVADYSSSSRAGGPRWRATSPTDGPVRRERVVDQSAKFAFASWRDAPNDLLQQCRVLQMGALGKPSKATLAQCFAQHGYTQLTRYRPASRFWAFQGIEGGWLLALSALPIAITVRLARRRAL
jgi:hypothetical protein